MTQVTKQKWLKLCDSAFPGWRERKVAQEQLKREHAAENLDGLDPWTGDTKRERLLDAFGVER